MRLRRHGDYAAPLSPVADDFVTARERSILGDWEANRLAFARRREEALHRPQVEIDYDTDVTEERPAETERTPNDTTALDVLAWRAATLAGDLLPWMTKGDAK